MLLSKVVDIICYVKYGTLHEHLTYLLESGVEKQIYFLKIYQKGLRLKKPMLHLKGI